VTRVYLNQKQGCEKSLVRGGTALTSRSPLFWPLFIALTEYICCSRPTPVKCCRAHALATPAAAPMDRGSCALAGSLWLVLQTESSTRRRTQLGGLAVTLVPICPTGIKATEEQ